MLQSVCVKPALTRFSVLASLCHCDGPSAGVPSSFLGTRWNESLWPVDQNAYKGGFLNPLVVTGLWPLGLGGMTSSTSGPGPLEM